MTTKKIQDLQDKILQRYAQEGRSFPRRETTDPYAIHICEAMSQQTQLSRVLPYRKKRMQDIPDYQSLAILPKKELLAHWSGLGFNSRALRLQTCAQILSQEFQGNPPQSKAELLKLPGI